MPLPAPQRIHSSVCTSARAEEAVDRVTQQRRSGVMPCAPERGVGGRNEMRRKQLKDSLFNQM